MKRQIIAWILSGAMLLGTSVTSFAAAGGGTQDSGFLRLVNFGHTVPKSLEPSDLRAVAGTSVKMRAGAAEALESMVAGLKSAGYSIRLNSGYRSYATQTYLFDRRVKEKQNSGMSYNAAYTATKKFTAVPGTSEHQLGLAIDLSTDGTLSDAFAGTAQGKWLAANCWKYGFILRYEEEKYALTQIGNEPWHFRYVGAPHAQIMKEKGWCLEEYFNYLKEHKYISLEAEGMVYEVYRTQGSTESYLDITDVSTDNGGGTVVTTYHPIDPMAHIKGHWSEASFAKLFPAGIPKSFGTISPEEAISRGEFAALYAQLLPPAPASQRGWFTDVAADYPHRNEILTVAAAGIMNGNAGKFRPEDLLTREEAAVAAAESVEGSNLQYLGYLDLADISGWAFQSVQELAYYQMMNGSGGKFRPKATLAWGEAASLLSKLKEFKEKTQTI